MSKRLPVPSEAASFFAAMYRQGNAPWDIGRAQPAFVELANAGEIVGKVLDLGCGTGDLVLEMAERGHVTCGVDIVPEAIRQAKAKSRLRGVEANFLSGDALEVHHLGERFDTVLDCGLFHGLSDAERQLYARELRKVLKPGGRLHLMAMSDWEDPAWGGPRRVTQQEFFDTFAEGFRVDDIREGRFLVRPGFQIRGHAWLVTVVREKDPKKAAKPRRGAANPAHKTKSPAGGKKSKASTAKPAQPCIPAGAATPVS